MPYKLHFSASEALYDDGGPLVGSDQVDMLTLGPFPDDYVELTYEYLRVAPDGDHVAAFDIERGVWVVGVDSKLRGVVTVLNGPDPNGLVFSDVVISYEAAV